METTLERPARAAGKIRPKARMIVFWMATALFCLQMSFTAVGDGPEAWGWAAGTGVLWGLSYFFWRRLAAMAARA